MAPIDRLPAHGLVPGRVASHQGWQDGWWAAAGHCPSPNQGPRPPGMAVGLVVLHSISLPPGQFGGDEVARLFTNQLDPSAHPYFEQLRGVRVSAHFLLRRDGALLQFVSCAQRAWHAGVSHWAGRDNCNDWSIGIELEGLEGGLFEHAQYAVLGRLLQAIGRAYPVREVVGHQHVAPGRKNDPGSGFDWAKLHSVTTAQAPDAEWQRPAQHPGLVRAAAQLGG